MHPTEVAGFLGSTGLAWFSYTAFMSGIQLFLRATPYGWVIIATAVGLGAVAAYLGDQFTKSVYDSIFHVSKQALR